MFFCNFLPSEALLRVHQISIAIAYSRTRRAARTLGERKSNEMFGKGANVLHLKRSLLPLHSFSTPPKVSLPHFCGGVKAESRHFQGEKQDHGKSAKDLSAGVEVRGCETCPDKRQVD